MIGSSRITGLLVLMVALLIAAPVVAWCDGSKLAVGDVVSVMVDGEKDLSKPYQVNGNGCIAVSMIGDVKIVDLNTSDASAVLTKALDKILVNPQVTAQFLERAKMEVFVVGQVLKKGLVDVGVGDSVVQALAQAGYDDSADLSHVNIRRGDEIIDVDLTKYLSGKDLSVNRQLQSGDTVVVPRVDMVGTIMVLGQVGKVGPMPLKREMTFREVMGSIGNVSVDADVEKITIKREGAADPIPVNYKVAMTGDPSADIKVLPGDTIFVPQKVGAFFTIFGGVGKPGQYPLKDNLTLSEAIGAAGGAVANLGDLRKVQIMHESSAGPKLAEPTMVDLTKVLKGTLQEPMVKRGDVIYVTEHKQKMGIMQILQTIVPFGWIFRR